MLTLLAALAGAQAPEWIWPDGSVDRQGALFALAMDGDCADLALLDADGLPQAATCERLEPADPGPLLLVRPDPAWATDALVVEGLAEAVDLEVVDDGIVVPEPPVPVIRTVTEDGVSYRVCHDGVIAAAVRGEAEPDGVGADTAVVLPGDTSVYLGATHLWPEAAPQATGRFWFSAWDARGAQTAWASDEVSLTRPGTVRVDLRLGFDPHAGDCPPATSAWLVGEESDAQGGVPPVRDDGGDPPDRGGCGCGGGAPSAAWALVALVAARRRHSMSSRST